MDPIDASGGVPDAAGHDPATPAEPRRSRRSLLKLLGLSALGLAGGAAARTSSASAADGSSLVLGQANAAASKTSLDTSGTITNDGALVVTANSADWAIQGVTQHIGVAGGGGIGVYGYGTFGGYFSGDHAGISLEPQTFAGPPTSNAYTQGDMFVDVNGILFLCIADGTPGTWIKVSHGGYRPLAAPARAYDSRNGDGRLGANGASGTTASPRSIGILAAIPAIPTQAVAVVGNLAVTGADGNGFATVWPSGAWPGTANINFTTVDLSNSFTVALGSGGSIRIASSTPTHAIIDIAGYIL
jgi:hypothetical protein